MFSGPALSTRVAVAADQTFELAASKRSPRDAEIATLPDAPATREALADECADVLLYLLLVAEKAGIDLEQAAKDKLRKNAEKYPVAQAYGSRRKYTEYR